MYQTMDALGTEIERQAREKHDYKVPASSPLMRMTFVESLQLDGVGDFPLTDYCHRQLGERYGIPAKYYDRMRSEDAGLLAQNLNTWMRRDDKRVMVRTLDGRARAFVSDQYRPLDNIDLWGVVAPVLSDTGAILRHGEFTDRRLYVKATFPTMSETIPHPVRVGDVVEYGIQITNSEVGAGAWMVEELVWTLSCSNGMVTQRALRRAHIGGTGGNGNGNGDIPRELMRDSTRALTDAALIAQTRDVVTGLLSGDNWQRQIDRLRNAQDRKFQGPSILAGIEEVANRFALSDGERDAVLKNFVEDGNWSAWGMASAVTLAAQAASNYDRRAELERSANAIVEMPLSEWQRLGVK